MEDLMQMNAMADMFSKKANKMVIGGLVALLVSVIVIIIFIKYRTKLVDAVHNKQLANSLDEEIDTNQITITQAQFNTYASSLYAAMDGVGTDEDKIYAVFRAMNTRADVLQLIKTFGVKDSQTLTEWLHGDLSASEIEKVNTILAGNNINYSF